MFLKGKWDTATFVTNYLPLMLFPVLYVGSRLYKRCRPLHAMEMDFVTGLKEIEADTYDEPPPHEEDLPPSYPLSFSDAYKQWAASAEASIMLFDVEKEYEEAENALTEMKKELGVLKERRFDFTISTIGGS